MLQKLLKGRTLALVAVIFVLCASMASAFTKYYTFEGMLVDVQDRSITVVNDETKYVAHIIVPAEFTLTPTFRPGMKVSVKLTKTNFGAWYLHAMKKL